MKKIDISKHEFVPRHVILSEKGKEGLLKQYNITLRHLPRILSSDPMVKILNGKVGDVVKIVRKSPTAGQTTYYRIVVKG